MLADQYRAYWLHQAVHHPDLLHTDEQRVFAMISIEQAFGDFRANAQEKGFILRPIHYTYQVGRGEDGRMLKRLQGGWIVAYYYDTRGKGTTDQLGAMDKAEALNEQLMEKVVADSLRGHPLWQRSLDSRQDFSSQPVMLTGDMAYTGYRTVFTWNHQLTLCSPPQLVAWGDGGATPHQL
ncbi:MAG: hypothetical protein AAFY91_02075 [Bacteroidota bacterium]